jgi:2-haloacid dehalogenase
MSVRYDAVLFDLLTALLDSWTLWDSVAGSSVRGRFWREAYLKHTYATGKYRPYETLIAEAAVQAGCPQSFADRLLDRWGQLEPWPGVVQTVNRLRQELKIGVVTNCSERLARLAAARVGQFDVIVSAERAGCYKPRDRPYRLALEEMGTEPAQTLFVAGSAYDLAGAAHVGMPVFWHNHIGMSAPPGTPLPLVERSDILTLWEFVTVANSRPNS